MDIFTTAVLTRAIQYLPFPRSYILDLFFRNVQTENTEEIHFDVENGKRRVAPFVSPLVAGKIMEQQGYVAKTFKPAYVKPKAVVDPNQPLKRALGEQIAGNLAPAQRLELIVQSILKDHKAMITRRLELMAVEAMRLGQVTVAGEQYPTTVVNYGRDAGLTITLAGGNRWGQVGVKPLDSLQDWMMLMLQKSGAAPTDVTMDVATWKVFRSDADVREQLNRFRETTNLDVSALREEGGRFMGNIYGFNIHVYAGWYIDDAGAEQPILPSGTVLMGSPQIEGYRAFGAVRDEDANYQALEMFSKSWKENDPSVRYVLTQSAPLVVPYRVNGSLAASVL